VNDMVLKRHEDKPWEWKDNGCFLNESKEVDCDGVMELKDVNLKGRYRTFTSGTPPDKVREAPYLEKIWVCNKCGFVFAE